MSLSVVFGFVASRSRIAAVVVTFRAPRVRGLLASMKVFGISSCSWMEKKVLEQFLLKQPKFLRVCSHPAGKSVLV